MAITINGKTQMHQSLRRLVAEHLNVIKHFIKGEPISIFYKASFSPACDYMVLKAIPLRGAYDDFYHETDPYYMFGWWNGYSAEPIEKTILTTNIFLIRMKQNVAFSLVSTNINLIFVKK